MSSVNAPVGTLTVTISMAASTVANSQTFATIVDDPRKTGVNDYQLTQNIATQISDAYTIGAPAVDGQIVIEKNNGAEKRNLGLLSNMRNDITNNRVPTPTRSPMILAPGDKITIYLINTVAASSVNSQTSTLYLTLTTVPVIRPPVVPVGPAGAGPPGLGLLGFLRRS